MFIGGFHFRKTLKLINVSGSQIVAKLHMLLKSSPIYNAIFIVKFKSSPYQENITIEIISKFRQRYLLEEQVLNESPFLKGVR